MARFEVTMSSGDKLLIEHDIASVEEMRLVLEKTDFLATKEVRLGAPGTLPDVVLSTRHMMLLRPLAEGATQGSSFRPKR
ncbi:MULTISPECIES: hypothetical protein [Afifella]|uniref:Uncharacterized protein n=1 Tax=Afifella marina DSM 2698 TaxID=1120955 RepID=A0A1G5M4N7_AFIMA|nr:MULTISPECIES: hypothetical protein [Afifella]MBK1623057.1 hypothetical protein [Afifella marina DSM 2698]MBK1626051.1 hypothetical protein [Afifella marina]MBK5917875.1 hypothetical protein [Afifella marina]MCT8269023.1 hypothetical protein [Afifella sp. JA880]RAI18190.1 hypothetical protein CH311_15955 [Afifella marina DSM 2698]